MSTTTTKRRTTGALLVAGAVAALVGGSLAVPGTAGAVPGCPPSDAVDSTQFPDFDGDSLEDPVHGFPSATPNGRGAGQLGTVRVDLSCTSGYVLTGAALGFSANGSARFGTTVNSADLDHDGFDDLVVSAPGQNLLGVVVIVFGSANGLNRGKPRQRINPAGLRSGDQFGAAVQIVRWSTGTGLVVGAPGTDVGAAKDAGAVYDVRFAPGSSAVRSVSRWVQGQDGVPGRAEKNDRFGEALSAGIVQVPAQTSDGQPYVAVGVPREDVGKRTDAGAVYLVRGGSPRGTKVLTQDSPRLAGKAEKGDRFGHAVLGTPGRLYVGVPGEDVGRAKDAGAVERVTVGTGAAIRGSAIRTQNTRGAHASAESGDRLGTSLGVQGGTESALEVAAGAPGEDVGRVKDAGAVTYLRFGKSCEECGTVTQNSRGVGGTAEKGDRFGASLTSTSSYSQGSRFHRALIGVPGEDIADRRDAGLIHDDHGWSIFATGTLPGLRMGEVASVY